MNRSAPITDTELVELEHDLRVTRDALRRACRTLSAGGREWAGVDDDQIAGELLDMAEAGIDMTFDRMLERLRALAAADGGTDALTAWNALAGHMNGNLGMQLRPIAYEVES